jgi:serine/threonine protein kinase/predicted negative regulator of RcsB-dependent stress response
MTPEEWQRVCSILESALELDPAKRLDFLNGACADASLRREVESLIAVQEQAGTNALKPGSALSFDAEEEAQFRLLPGKRIGAYEILEEIAVGGMGAVYRAVRADGQYKQQVALKIVRSELGAEATATRFRNERQILASLDHPNIAKILDGGTTTDGLPYFVMEFIDGLPITDYCDQHKLTIDERLKIFRTVCSAVHYAHQHLVIHRDIKPGNILVTLDGAPKLLDFGIAKILDPSLLAENAAATLAGLWVMTPEYASPEQLRGDAITTATDVYSLGLILYELLAGRPAHHFPSHKPHEIARVILETDPDKPSTAIQRNDEIPEQSNEKAPRNQEFVSQLRADTPEKLLQRLSGDLDNIVLKAIRKDARDRYSSVDQFSEDIRRHLEHLPVLARKSTVAYRCRKYILRHKIGVAAAALVLISLLAGIVVTLREARIARANELRAERRFNDVRKLSNSLIFEFHDSIQNLPGATPARKLLLDRALEYLDSLAKESAGDLSLQRELATAYQRIGELQGDPRNANLGETDAAVTSLQKALAICESVAQANPANSDDQLKLASAHRVLSNMLGNTGKPEAREHVEQVIAISERILKADGTNVQAQLERAAGYAEFAYFQEESGDASGSVQSLRNALAINENFLKGDPADKKLQEKVAVLRVRIGRVLPALGDRDEALQMNRAGLDLFESLATQTDARSKRRLAVSLVFRGDIQMMNGEFENALKSYQRSLTMLHAMQEGDPQNVLYQLDVAGATGAVGRAFGSLGQRTQAVGLLERSLGIYERHFAQDRSYKDLPYWLGQHEIWKGEVLSRDGKASAALESYQKAVKYLEQIPNLESPNMRCDLAAGHAKVAAAFAALGRPQEASASYQTALRMAEPLESTKSPNVLALYVVADADFGMGELSKAAARDGGNPASERSKYWADSCHYYQKSSQAWRQVPNPSRITPSGFSVAEPEAAAKRLRECEPALAKPAAQDH